LEAYEEFEAHMAGPPSTYPEHVLQHGLRRTRATLAWIDETTTAIETAHRNPRRTRHEGNEIEDGRARLSSSAKGLIRRPVEAPADRPPSASNRASQDHRCGALKVDVPEAVGRARHVRAPRVLARAFRICRVCMAEPRRDPARILLVTSRASSGPCQEGGGRQKRQPRRRPCHSMPSSISETSGSASPVPRASYAARIASIAIA
jgi:hypothetical protein